MSKVLTEYELLRIITDTLEDGPASLVDEYESHGSFIEALANLIGYYGGADVVCVSEPDGDGLGWCAHFAANECAPSDGGVFQYFDNDAPIEEWLNETLGD